MMSKTDTAILLLFVAFAVYTGIQIGASSPETYMGHVQKIMYVHVPSVMLAYILFFGVFLFSWSYLWKKKETSDIYATVCAETATLFTLITLVTGSIWGKPTWNTYWTWDAKLTITLILFLIFSGYVMVRKFVEPGEDQAKICAVIGIIGFLSVPLNHMSVKWWRSIHQDSTFLTPKNTISDEYSFILYLSLCTFILLTVFIFRIRIKLEKNYRRFLRIYYGRLN